MSVIGLFFLGGSTPAEDEGISSSERSLTPEGDTQRDASVYEVYNVQSQTIPIKDKQKPTTKNCVRITEDDEETTIDEVIEELKNIINDAETEQYLKEQKLKKEAERKLTVNKVCMRVETSVSETEIVPANIHPQPPRRTRSLVHLFIPAEDYDYDNKEIFFENETTFTSEEGSDSLLSASKYHLPRVDKNLKTCDAVKRSESFRHLDNTPLSPSFQDQKLNTMKELTKHRLKSKSLDRIDDGLEAMVDIVVTEDHPARVPNVLKKGNVEEKKKIFLPNQEAPYYFPRLQEKRSNTSSFLIKRGHTNAGLYSGGYVIKEDQKVNLKKKADYVSAMNCKNSLEKVTDLPSGLY